MIHIQPTLAGFPLDHAQKINMEIKDHSTTDKLCRIKWQLFNLEEFQLAEGYITLSEEEYAQWDSDNESLEDIILEKLKLERKLTN